jgi:hypothetical protein
MHQVRAVAASLAFDAEFSLPDLCSRAMWLSESVFVFKNYYCPKKVN